MFSYCNLVSFTDRGIDSLVSVCKNFVKFARLKQVAFFPFLFVCAYETSRKNLKLFPPLRFCY